jgi:hypothetical protein
VNEVARASTIRRQGFRPGGVCRPARCFTERPTSVKKRAAAVICASGFSAPIFLRFLTISASPRSISVMGAKDEKGIYHSIYDDFSRRAFDRARAICSRRSLAAI